MIRVCKIRPRIPVLILIKHSSQPELQRIACQVCFTSQPILARTISSTLPYTLIYFGATLYQASLLELSKPRNRTILRWMKSKVSIQKQLSLPKADRTTEPNYSPDITSKASFSSAENAVATIQCPPGINEKALLRKIDIRVIPILFLIYLASFFYRVNFANALKLG